MAKCPKLEYESHSFFGNANDKYVCTVSEMRMELNDPTITSVCKSDHADLFLECPIYQSTIVKRKKTIYF